jgi:hypothetical protein
LRTTFGLQLLDAGTAATRPRLVLPQHRSCQPKATEAVGAREHVQDRLPSVKELGPRRLPIALGYATCGEGGFEGRCDYAAIGAVTNLASRLADEVAVGAENSVWVCRSSRRRCSESYRRGERTISSARPLMFVSRARADTRSRRSWQGRPAVRMPSLELALTPSAYCRPAAANGSPWRGGSQPWRLRGDGVVLVQQAADAVRGNRSGSAAAARTVAASRAGRRPRCRTRGGCSG